MTQRAEPRVLVGRLFHESHAFSPFVTPASEFTVTRGAALIDEAQASGTTLGGIVRELARLGASIVPSVSASAPPSGLVDDFFHRAIKAELIEAAVSADPDAIALELHGAMATTRLADVEGDLLTDLRAAVGDNVVIGVGLDLHAHLTPAMLAAADLCIACKSNPHADVVECGEKVAAGAMAVLSGSLDPVSTLVKVRMTLPGALERHAVRSRCYIRRRAHSRPPTRTSGISRSITSIEPWMMSTWAKPSASFRMETIPGSQWPRCGSDRNSGTVAPSSRTT